LDSGSGKFSASRQFPASDRTVAGLAGLFKHLADESRIRILLALAYGGEMNVSSLCQQLRASRSQAQTSQPAVSHHLKLLRMAGLVACRRQGKQNFYRLESGPIRELLEQFFADSNNGARLLQFGDFTLAYRRNRR
jgi:ArsR family transcriptional regulator